MKKVRETSVEAYLEIKREGLLGEKQQEIYECIYNNQPITAREAMQLLNMDTNMSGRFTELREMGVIQEAGQRNCEVTGRKAIIWVVSGNLPEKRKRNDRSAKVQDIVSDLQYIKEGLVFAIHRERVESTIEKLRSL